MTTHSQIKKRIAFLGAGNMAEALISGLTGSRLVPAKSILASDISRERLAYIKKKYRVAPATDNAAAVQKSDIIFLAIKPQQMESVLTGLAGAVKPEQLYISIAAGITTTFIEKYLPSGTAVVRAMPNTPALVGAGAIGLCGGKWARKNDIKTALALFSSVGMALELPEKLLNAVTAVSGSGPAYVFYLAEAMAQAGEELGLPKEVAEKLARQTVFGAGTMLAKLPETAAELRRRVTSPNGTTEAALKYLEKKNFLPVVGQAIKQAHKRADELTR